MNDGPTDAAILNAGVGRRIREHAVVECSIGPIAHGFRVKLRHVVVGKVRLGRHNNVAPIAKAFTMWTVGLNTEHIAQEGALCDLLNLVEEIIRASEGTNRF